MTALMDAFDAGTLDPAGFTHRDHIAVAHEALQSDEFFAASARVARGLRGLAAKAGAPEKYSATITLAFLSLIAERMVKAEGLSEFLAANPDLLDGSILRRLYTTARLSDPRAQRYGLLPDLAVV